MTTPLPDAMARMRRKFLVKDTEGTGFIGGYMVKAEAQVTDTERVLEFIATTNDVDLDEEVVDPAGGDWSYFDNANQKKMFIDHQYESEYCIGLVRAKSKYMEGTAQIGWKMRAFIYPGLKTPHADDFWTRSLHGPMGISIGFISLEVTGLTPAEKKTYPGAQTIVRRWKAIEVSGTAIPCNVKCQTMAGPASLYVPKKSIQLSPTQIQC